MDGEDQTAASTLAKNRFDQEVKLYELYRDYIKHEDNLRGQRTGWLLTIQGFLFAALGVSLTVKTNHPEYPVEMVQFIFAIVGIFVSLNSMVRQDIQEKVFRRVEESLEKMKCELRKSQRVKTQPDETVTMDVPQSGYWINQLPELRYAGTNLQKSVMRMLPFYWIFITAWLAVLLFLLWSWYHPFKVFVFEVNTRTV